jgi:thiol-disulfide isomerase/thioredoxin
MKYPKSFIPLALAALLFVSCADQKSQNPRSLSEASAQIETVIQRATFQDVEGNDITIADFQGKVVLIDFWETWCGPCLQVFPALDSLKTEYPDDFEVLTVNLIDGDTKADVEQFMADNDYDFVFTMDVNDIGDEIITLGIPFKVYIDPDGFLIKAELGSAGTQGDYEMAKVIIEDNKRS